MDDCKKMQMFIEENYAMEYILWEQTILPLNNIEDDDTRDITNITID